MSDPLVNDLRLASRISDTTYRNAQIDRLCTRVEIALVAAKRVGAEERDELADNMLALIESKAATPAGKP